MQIKKCPFCSLDAERIREASRLSLFIDDGFPVSPGHALLIPRRHVQSLFELDEDERNDLMDLLGRARKVIQAQLHPDGFNIGINDGAAAGQTVMHLHVHLIWILHRCDRWAYGRAFDLGLPTWLRGREVVPLSPEYRLHLQ